MRILQIIRSLRISFSCYFSAFGYNVLLERVIKMKARQLPPYKELSIEERERLVDLLDHLLTSIEFLRRFGQTMELPCHSKLVQVVSFVDM